MKIAFFFNKWPSSALTKFWTGSTCYHVAIVDEELDKMYDMNLIMRRRKWSEYAKSHEWKLVDTPVAISRVYLENLLDTDNNSYGWKDYLLFALRPIYHLFGKSTRNADGIICSELVANILTDNGWTTYFTEVPSPADLERVLNVQQ